MIFVTDKGRLCNNILQYGHVYAWGREHGVQTVSMRFAYKYKYFHIGHTRHHHLATYLAAKLAARWRLIPHVEFNDPAADTAPLEAVMQRSRFCVVSGWWVPWHDLFIKYKEEILGLFAFDDAVVKAASRRLGEQPEADLRLGVHVRRGDYRVWHGGKYYFSDEQYISCIRQTLALYPGRRVSVFVCGNDPTLDKDLFRRSLPGVSVSFPEGSPGEDLCLLSRCDCLIGAPSTFTLVAAMYRDLPLCWILDADKPVTADSFGRFDDLLYHML